MLERALMNGFRSLNEAKKEKNGEGETDATIAKLAKKDEADERSDLAKFTDEMIATFEKKGCAEKAKNEQSENGNGNGNGKKNGKKNGEEDEEEEDESEE